MTINELIAELQHAAASNIVGGGGAEVKLFDREKDEEHVVRPEDDKIDFTVTRGDGEVFIEFN